MHFVFCISFQKKKKKLNEISFFLKNRLTFIFLSHILHLSFQKLISFVSYLANKLPKSLVIQTDNSLLVQHFGLFVYAQLFLNLQVQLHLKKFSTNKQIRDQQKKFFSMGTKGVNKSLLYLRYNLGMRFQFTFTEPVKVVITYKLLQEFEHWFS